MTDRPMLFSGAMVRANLSGLKTQTRRVLWFPGVADVVDFVRVATDKEGRSVYEMKDHAGKAVARPAGKGIVDYHFKAPIAVGDQIWAREEFSGPHRMKPKVNPPATWPIGTDVWYWADGSPEEGDWTKPKPGMHMPRWMSRITLTVTDVRIERLLSITDADAIAEGIEKLPYAGNDPQHQGQFAWKDYRDHPHAIAGWRSPVDSYRTLWESINGEGSWAANPWVLAYTFTHEIRNIGEVG